MNTGSGALPRTQIEGSEQPDFGTYHCSTPHDSAEAREKIKLVFTKAFSSLPFSRDEKIKILDVGCGLGFVSCACAEFYRNALVTGFDTFDHSSLRGSSLAKARRNADILRLSARVRFEKGNIFASEYGSGEFGVFVSNLVFHNFGRKRFEAYGMVASWVHPGSYVILGDLMFYPAADLKHLSSLFSSVKEIPAKEVISDYRMLVMSGPK